MRNKIRQILWLLCYLPVLIGCIGEDDYANDPRGNFEQLWKIIGEQYCFLDAKGIDWDAVHNEYSKLIIPSMSNDDLFDILSQMSYILKDRHVSLSSASRISYYDAWYQDHPWNYGKDTLYNYYLGSANLGYRTSANLKCRILDNNIGYIRYESFNTGVGGGNLDEVLYYLQICNGLIIDVRDSGGSNLINFSHIAARFADKLALTGYIQHKTGPGHNDFSEVEPTYLEPSSSIRWQGKVVILTNRRCYSATNDFVNVMHNLNNDNEGKKITQLGNQTSDGSGLSFSSELPSDWSVRLPASPHFDKCGKSLEDGVKPDVCVDMDGILEEGMGQGGIKPQKRDPLIEEAFEILSE